MRSSAGLLARSDGDGDGEQLSADATAKSASVALDLGGPTAPFFLELASLSAYLSAAIAPSPSAGGG